MQRQQEWIARCRQQFADPLRERWGHYCPSSVRAWIMVGVISLLAVSLCLAIGLSGHRPAANEGWLLDGRRFTDVELSALLDTFAQRKLLDYHVDDGRIQVPRQQYDRYLAAVVAANVLAPDLTRHQAAAIEQGSIFESTEERRQRMQTARERDLQQAIRSMDRIEDAIVQFDELREEGFHRRRIVTATVGLRPKPGCRPTLQQVQTIRQLLSGAKAGLKPSDIRVVDLRSGRSFPAPDDDDPLLASAEQYLLAKEEVEQTWQEKIQRTLHFIPRVHVVVDAQASRRKTADQGPPQRLTVLVGVPDSYLRSRLASRGGASSEGRRERFQRVLTETDRQVRRALDVLWPAGRSADVQIALTVQRFDDRLAGSHRSESRGMADRWQSIGGAVLLAIFAAGLLSAMRSGRILGAREPEPHVLRPEFTRPGPARPVASAVQDEALRRSVVELIEQDPSKAAEVLNRWISQAG